MESYEQDLINKCEHLFNLLHLKENKFTYSFKPRNYNHLRSFISALEKHYNKSAGNNFIVEFVVFQFAYYTDQTTKVKIQTNWVFGKKAIERWKNKDIENYLYFLDVYLQKFGTSLIELKKTVTKKKETVYDYKHEDIERKRFYGTPKGLLHCLTFTTGFRKCIICIECNNRQECEK